MLSILAKYSDSWCEISHQINKLSIVYLSLINMYICLRSLSHLEKICSFIELVMIYLYSMIKMVGIKLKEMTAVCLNESSFLGDKNH